MNTKSQKKNEPHYEPHYKHKLLCRGGKCYYPWK